MNENIKMMLQTIINVAKEDGGLQAGSLECIELEARNIADLLEIEL